MGGHYLKITWCHVHNFSSETGPGEPWLYKSQIHSQMKICGVILSGGWVMEVAKFIWSVLTLLQLVDAMIAV